MFLVQFTQDCVCPTDGTPAVKTVCRLFDTQTSALSFAQSVTDPDVIRVPDDYVIDDWNVPAATSS